MSEKEKITNLKKAITELLTRKDMSEFRWTTVEERTSDDDSSACLIIDGDAYAYFWEHDGMKEMSQACAKHGYFIAPISYIDIGFYTIAEWQAR